MHAHPSCAYANQEKYMQLNPCSKNWFVSMISILFPGVSQLQAKCLFWILFCKSTQHVTRHVGDSHTASLLFLPTTSYTMKCLQVIPTMVIPGHIMPYVVIPAASLADTVCKVICCLISSASMASMVRWSWLGHPPEPLGCVHKIWYFETPSSNPQ